ncbi:hypothetical protein Vadar_020616 [Vaccinium darrowii]|uniref:Uncharacterized protein n=1 Tax=Vaccinium darrowii TaxID=229202 RepID=A0ACB7X2U2_9ERIC|nr:hypothetical protein Vadar_020616 [Vaccinium darrowii]
MDIPFISLDLALMTALLERWHPETHSFHLGLGEWTVTLQDVEVILGVPVDGLPIVGSTEQDWDKLCQELLGLTPRAGVSRTGGKVKLSWLRTHFKGHLKAGRFRGFRTPLLVVLAMGLDNSTQLGSACLAGLYHFICHGSKKNNNDVGGCFILLQLWAWEWFPYFAPGPVGKRVRPPDAPLGARSLLVKTLANPSHFAINLTLAALGLGDVQWAEELVPHR